MRACLLGPAKARRRDFVRQRRQRRALARSDRRGGSAIDAEARASGARWLRRWRGHNYPEPLDPPPFAEDILVPGVTVNGRSNELTKLSDKLTLLSISARQERVIP